MAPRRKAITSMSLDVPRLLLKYAAGLGLDTGAVCRYAGLDITSLQNPEGRMTSDRFGALWAEVARRADDPDLGLHVGEAIPGFSSGHILLGVMLNCGTLREALERFCRYHGLLGDGPPPELRDEGHRCMLGLRSVPAQEGYYPDAVLAMLAVIVRRLTENQVRPVEVHFTRSQPADVTEHRRIFDAPLLFAQSRAGLVFEQESLSTAIFLANPIVLDALERVAQGMMERLTPSTPWASRTGGTIAQLMLRGEVPRLPLVAQALTISPRHLQNKLRVGRFIPGPARRSTETNRAGLSQPG